jgi:tRNA modification GTPase
MIESENCGKMAKYGINVVFAGNTNVGKSSLMNRLLAEDRAIVTDIEGTTRDVLNESIIYKGVKINLTDTAGIRESSDSIEREGIRRAKEAIQGADIVLNVKDISQKNAVTMSDDFAGKRVIEVFNKTDLHKTRSTGKIRDNIFYVSAATGEGIDVLLEEIASLYLNGKAAGGEMLTNQRHLFAVKKAYESIKSAVDGYDDAPTDCILVDLKAAWEALGEITGSTASEDIIDAVFSRFCVGK